jgi:hypothetical protein
VTGISIGDTTPAPKRGFGHCIPHAEHHHDLH